MKKIIIGILILLMIGLIYIILIKQKIKEDFAVTDPPSESLDCSDYSLTGLGANPLVDRNGSNVIINPSSIGNVVMGSPGNGCWNSDTSLNNASIIVNLNNLIKITNIVTKGLKFFKVYFSQTDNTPSSYEEILYQDKDSITQKFNSIYFTASSYENPMQFDNLLTQDGQPVFAQYIKIVPVKGDSLNVNPDTTVDNSIGPNGVKLEIFGVQSDNKILTGGESLIGTSKFYNINGDEIENNWISEVGNKEPRLRIVFSENGVITPKTVYSLIFSPSNNSNISKQWVKEFSLTYLHNESKVSETIYNIKGNSNCGNNQVQYYFNTPIIATELIIKPTQINNSSKRAEMKIVDIFGSPVTKIQERVLLDKNKQKFCSSDSPDGCGSVSDLLGKQAEIQQLCDALDLQDQIKENNQRIQKNRQYIMQLEEHDKKIANLENVVDNMKHLRELRQKANDTGLLDQKNKQTEIDAKLKDLVAERVKSQSQFNVKLNIKPGSLEGMKKIVESTEAAKGVPNDTSKTPLEGFTNYSGTPSFNNVIPNDPFNNRWLEHKFKLKMQEKGSQGFNQPTMLEKQFEQVMNQGFDYINYTDNTNQNQRQNKLNLNNRVFDTSDPAYQYEKINQPKFYEDIALKSTHCDTNVKFIKQMK